MATETILVTGSVRLPEEFKDVAARHGHEVVLAGSHSEALRLLNAPKPISLVFLDAWPEALNLLAHIQTSTLNILPICMINPGDAGKAVDLMRKGAFDVLIEPIHIASIEILFLKLKAYRAVADESHYHRKVAIHFSEEVIARAPNMREVFRLRDKIAPTAGAVLISGEKGTGKDLLARTIHRQSPRVNAPFIRIDCAAFPESLLEKELFGEETGMSPRRTGCFGLACGGTLVLDEASEMNPAVQSKLLQLMTEKEEAGRFCARVICMTRRNLQQRVKEGAFSEDLFRRLAPIPLPPLRERSGDVIMIAEFFLRRFTDSNQDSPKISFDLAAKEALASYSWPGNVRELRTCIERAVLLAQNELITVQHLALPIESIMAEGMGVGEISGDVTRVDKPPLVYISEITPVLQAAPSNPVTTMTRAGITNISGGVGSPLSTAHVDPDNIVFRVGQPLSEIENEMIRRTFELTKGNRIQTAKLLGISVRTLYTKLLEAEKAGGLKLDVGES